MFNAVSYNYIYYFSKFETKPDSELFVVDTGGEAKVDDEVEDKKPLSAKLQKRAKLKELPRCFEILTPTSKVL